jgi:hypothetical protein
MTHPAKISTVDTTLVTADSTEYTIDAVDTPTVYDYGSLVTPWQANPIKARFLETIRANLQPYADSQALVSTIFQAYDLDYAEGVQLDADGEWIGLSRVVPVPLPNTFFSVGSALLGVGYGYIKGKFDSYFGLSLLPDDLYRRLLYTKIEANSWDGTNDELYTILRTYFTDPSTLIIIDDQCFSQAPPLFFAVGDPARGVGFGKIKSVSYTGPASLGYGFKIGFAGKIPSSIDLAILSAGVIPLKAMGSKISLLVTTVDQAPLFGVGVQDKNVSGVGSGAIGASPAYVASLMNS